MAISAPRLPVYTPPRLPHIDSLLAFRPPRRLDDHEQADADEAPGRLSDAQGLSSMLGQGRVDPFNVTVIAHLPLFVTKHLDYGESMRVQGVVMIGIALESGSN